MQIIERDSGHPGVLEFGTELDRQRRQVDRRPHRRFAKRIDRRLYRARDPRESFGDQVASGWLERLKTIIPTFGIEIRKDAAACRNIRAETAQLLKFENV